MNKLKGNNQEKDCKNKRKKMGSQGKERMPLKSSLFSFTNSPNFSKREKYYDLTVRRLSVGAGVNVVAPLKNSAYMSMKNLSTMSRYAGQVRRE
jgi:hypothetical protein